jgi:hypothetical protein
MMILAVVAVLWAAPSAHGANLMELKAPDGTLAFSIDDQGDLTVRGTTQQNMGTVPAPAAGVKAWVLRNAAGTIKARVDVASASGTPMGNLYLAGALDPALTPDLIAGSLARLKNGDGAVVAAFTAAGGLWLQRGETGYAVADGAVLRIVDFPNVVPPGAEEGMALMDAGAGLTIDGFANRYCLGHRANGRYELALAQGWSASNHVLTVLHAGDLGTVAQEYVGGTAEYELSAGSTSETRLPLSIELEFELSPPTGPAESVSLAADQMLAFQKPWLVEGATLELVHSNPYGFIRLSTTNTDFSQGVNAQTVWNAGVYHRLATDFSDGLWTFQKPAAVYLYAPQGDPLEPDTTPTIMGAIGGGEISCGYGVNVPLRAVTDAVGVDTFATSSYFTPAAAYETARAAHSDWPSVYEVVPAVVPDSRLIKLGEPTWTHPQYEYDDSESPVTTGVSVPEVIQPGFTLNPATAVVADATTNAPYRAKLVVYDPAPYWGEFEKTVALNESFNGTLQPTWNGKLYVLVYLFHNLQASDYFMQASVYCKDSLADGVSVQQFSWDEPRDAIVLTSNAIRTMPVSQDSPNFAKISTAASMPGLYASMVSTRTGLTGNADWRMSIQYTRGNMNDTSLYPSAAVRTLPVANTWNVSENYENRVRGGKGEITCVFGSQTLTHEFHIRGENPDDAWVEFTIDYLGGTPHWYARAIARHESKIAAVTYPGPTPRLWTYYNQFNPSGTGSTPQFFPGPDFDDYVGNPNMHTDTNNNPHTYGWGIIQTTQIEDEGVTIDDVWDWYHNITTGLSILDTKRQNSWDLTFRYVDQDTQYVDQETREPFGDFIVLPTGHSFFPSGSWNYWNLDTIKRYNGGRIFTVLDIENNIVGKPQSYPHAPTQDETIQDLTWDYTEKVMRDGGI